MKRGFVVVIIIVIIVGTLLYFLLSSPLTVSDEVSFTTSTNGAYKTLSQQSNWDKWAPGEFTITKRLVNTIELDVDIKGTRTPVSILLIPKSNDSLNLLWRSVYQQTSNPLKKIGQFKQATVLINKMNAALKNFQLYVSANENVYGSKITETSTKDTFLIATRFESGSYPSNQLIYENINKLNSFASGKGVKVVSSPMLNVSTADSVLFKCMVALPINKIIDGNKDIFFVRMIPGRFLTTEVKGGPFAIEKAHKMMDQYFKDYNRIAMAIPFEYLITDRLKEPDTSKWMTKIYCPVY